MGKSRRSVSVCEVCVIGCEMKVRPLENIQYAQFSMASKILIYVNWFKTSGNENFHKYRNIYFIYRCHTNAQDTNETENECGDKEITKYSHKMSEIDEIDYLIAFGYSHNKSDAVWLGICCAHELDFELASISLIQTKTRIKMNFRFKILTLSFHSFHLHIILHFCSVHFEYSMISRICHNHIHI